MKGFTMQHKQIAVGLLAVVMAGAVPALGQELDKRLEQLEQEVKILKRQREIEQEEAAKRAEQAKKTPLLQADEKGFGFKSADGNFALRIGGQVKADGLFFLGESGESFSDQFTISSARLVLSGTVFQDFDFTVSGEFGGGNPQLWDAFIEWKHWSAFKVKAGRYKQPFGLERLQADANNAFTSLGLPSNLVPGRDVSLQIGGDLYDSLVNYTVSVGNGVPDGTSANGDFNDDKDLTGRLWLQPLKKTDVEALQGIGVGIASTYGLQSGSTNSPFLPTYKTAGGNTFFSYRTGTNGTVAAGNRFRLSPQASYYYGRLGILGEYVISAQEVKRGTARDTIRNDAWQVLVSFALTDDEPTYKGISPKKPFSLSKGQWGAFELVSRFGQLTVDDAAFAGGAASYANPYTSARKATAWGVGLNWYLNRNIRIFLDYDQTFFDGGASTGAAPNLVLADRPTEYFLSTRFQVAF
jgi:phosphate-selective porin OprO/OprP